MLPLLPLWCRLPGSRVSARHHDSPAWSNTLDYDGNGNRLHKNWSSGQVDNYLYDPNDRLQSVSSASGAVSSYSYVAYLRPGTIGSTNNYKSLSWDVEDRLASISQYNGLTTTLGTYGYNGAGARVSRNVGNVSHYLARDGADVTSPVVNESLSSGTPTNYLPGVGLSQGSALRTSASDQLGTQNHELDGSGNVTSTRECDAFGNPISTSGTPLSLYGFAGDWGYMEDGESGLKCVGHRLYDPAIGRFLTSDPACDGRNWFSYCDGDPIHFVDADGLKRFHVLIVVGGAMHKGENTAPFMRVAKLYQDGCDALRRLGRDIDSEIVVTPTEQVLAHKLATADGVIGEGHGGSWKPFMRLSGVPDGLTTQSLTPQLVRKALHGKKLTFIILEACHQGSPQLRKLWLAVTRRLAAYPGRSFDPPRIKYLEGFGPWYGPTWYTK